MSDLDDRARALREWEVRECPEWCVQPADEHEYEAHLGEVEKLTLSDGTEIEIVTVVPWEDGGSGEVKLSVTKFAHMDFGIILTADDADVLAAALDQHRYEMDDWSQMREAYPGALDDDEDDEDG